MLQFPRSLSTTALQTPNLRGSSLSQGTSGVPQPRPNRDSQRARAAAGQAPTLAPARPAPPVRPRHACGGLSDNTHSQAHARPRPRHIPADGGTQSRGRRRQRRAPRCAAPPPPRWQLRTAPRLLAIHEGVAGGAALRQPLTSCHCQPAASWATLGRADRVGRARPLPCSGTGTREHSRTEGVSSQAPGTGLETAPLLPPRLSPRPPRTHGPEARSAQEGLPLERVPRRCRRCRCLRRSCTRHERRRGRA